MKITVGRTDEPVFHPITVVLETRAEAATLLGALSEVPGQAATRNAFERLFGAAGSGAPLLEIHNRQYHDLLAAYAAATRSA